ncbi:MAG: hypothetical protein HZB91_07350 [Elusimicrobia bacterium]|nr:hypothetical protein [Elusimicrobiota bacterium]
MKEKKCCNVDVTETEKGLRVEIIGAKVKECLSTLMNCCCSKGGDAKGSGKKGC